MSSLRDSLEQLRTRLTAGPETVAEELDYASGWEAGLRHPYLPSFMLCGDDGSIQLASGRAARMQLDGGSGQVSLDSAKLSLQAENLHLHAPPGGLWIGYQRFDPLLRWHRGFFPDYVDWLWNGPLVLNTQADLAGLAIPLVAGPPDPSLGQFNITLGSLMHPQPLLGPDEGLRILAEKLAQLAKELLPHGE